MKNLLLLSLLISSTAIYAGHHEQHDMDSMHSHEGHIHNEMVNGKTLEVDAQRFDHVYDRYRQQRRCRCQCSREWCATFVLRGIEKTFGKDKRD